MAMAEHTPRVLVFACNWCSYAAADLAGTTRLEMPSEFTLLRVMCTGRVDPLHLLRALAMGADGVLVSGCHPGDCHYTSGNLHARRRVDFVRTVLEQLGLAERLEMVHISAAEGRRFQKVMTSFAAKIRGLGPSPVGKNQTVRPDGGKRNALRELLAGIVADLEVKLPKDAWIPEELVPEGYSEPCYDASLCTGCGACYQACPVDNIELRDGDGERSIAHFHSRCVGCRSCEEVCPEHAVEVRPRFDLQAFLSGRRHHAVQLELRLCRECGAPVAPTNQLERAAERTREQGVQVTPSDTCDACRRRAHARALTTMTMRIT